MRKKASIPKPKEQGTPTTRKEGTTTFSSIFISSHNKGTMAERMLLLFLVVLGSSWTCDSRELSNIDLWSNLPFTPKSSTSELRRIPNVCSLCEEYTAKALHYLNEKKTQNEIIDILHNTCYHQLHSFHKQCISLVDYYVPLIFIEVASIQPGELCNKANLCQNIANISSQAQQNSCGFCKDTVSALLLKLNNPNTQVEIIETLLKVSSTVEKYANKYKMILKYGALGYVNVEKLLETRDICTRFHACKASRVINHKGFLSF